MALLSMPMYCVVGANISDHFVTICVYVKGKPLIGMTGNLAQ